jgi:iron(III) transport system ATP-binding protein
MELSCGPSAVLSLGEAVTLALRPEDVVLHDDTRPDVHGSNRCEAQVQDLEFLGAFCRVRVHLPRNGQSLVVDVPSAQALNMGLNTQRHLFIDLPADRLQVFGRSAGAR